MLIIMNNIKQNLDYRINIPTNYENLENYDEKNYSNSDIYYNDIPKEVCIDLQYDNEPIKEYTIISIINKIKKWIK
jgi:hypothetical protein